MERQIEVAGAEGPPAPPPDSGRPDRRIVPVVSGMLGLVIGSVATFALSQPPPLEVSTPGTTEAFLEPSPIDPSPSTAPPVAEPTLAELIPGLASDLVAFGTDVIGAPVVQLWELDRPAPRLRPTSISFGRADLSGRFLASLEDQRYGDGFNLIVGNPNFVETIATDVGSFMWSATNPAELAWTERTETGFAIRTRSVNPAVQIEEAFNVTIPDDVFVAWFRDASVTIQDNQGMLTTLSHDGSVVATSDFNQQYESISGFATATDIAGVAMIEDVPHLMSPQLELLAEIPDAGASPCFPAEFAPGGDGSARRLAMLCLASVESGVLVVDIGIEDDGSASVSAPALFPLDQPMLPVWLGDDRFFGVIEPGNFAGLPRTDFFVFDLDTGNHYTLSWPGSVSHVIAFGQR